MPNSCYNFEPFSFCVSLVRWGHLATFMSWTLHRAELKVAPWGLQICKLPKWIQKYTGYWNPIDLWFYDLLFLLWLGIVLHKHMDVRQGSATWESWIVFAVDHIDKPGFFPRRLEDWILVCCTTRYVEGLLCQLHQSCMHVLHATALSTWYSEDFGHEPTRVHALACVCDLTGRFELNIGRHRFNMLRTPHICLSRKLSMDRSLFFSSHGSSVGCLPSPMVLQES